MVVCVCVCMGQVCRNSTTKLGTHQHLSAHFHSCASLCFSALSGATGTFEISDEFVSGQPTRSYQLGVSVTRGSGNLWRTKIVTFTPQFVLINQTPHCLVYYQQVCLCLLLFDLSLSLYSLLLPFYLSILSLSLSLSLSQAIGRSYMLPPFALVRVHITPSPPTALFRCTFLLHCLCWC
jgi:Vacuolar-sorting associated protein 13, adaptor binding domain